MFMTHQTQYSTAQFHALEQKAEQNNKGKRRTYFVFVSAREQDRKMFYTREILLNVCTFTSEYT